MLASVAHTSFSSASSNKAPNRMPANGQKIDTQGSGRRARVRVWAHFGCLQAQAILRRIGVAGRERGWNFCPSCRLLLPKKRSNSR